MSRNALLIGNPVDCARRLLTALALAVALCGFTHGVDAELTPTCVVTGSRVYPLEPMSPTSERCALRIEHGPTGVAIEAFPGPGSNVPPGLDRGDVQLPDGRRQMAPPREVEPELTRAWSELEQRVAWMTGDELIEQCRAMDPGLHPRWHFLVFGGLALALLLAAAGARRRSAAVSLALLGAGVLALVITAVPLLWGESYGTQELQRLLSALKPVGDIIQGHHGDVRHPAGLFLLLGPAAWISGSVLGLRVFCLGLLALGAGLWAAARWRRGATGEALLPLGLLIHPVMLESSIEVSPYAAYSAGVLVIAYALGRGGPASGQALAAGLLGQLFMAATNHVGLAVGTFLVLFYTLQSWRELGRRALLVRIALALVVAAPFALGLLDSLAAEVGFRDTAERLPQLAWGSRELEMLVRGLFDSALFGGFLWVAVVLAALLGWRGLHFCRDALVLLGLGVGILGMFLALAPTARVQPSYGVYSVPLLLVGLGQLVDTLPGRRLPLIAGLGALGVLMLDLISVGPIVARRAPGPEPVAAVARAAAAAADSCPTMLSATNDVALPLLPELVDPRRFDSVRLDRPAALPGFEDARVQVFPERGLHLVSLFARHRLKREPSAELRAVSEAFRAERCVQVLYERSLPLPELYRYLGSSCESVEDAGPFHLFRCETRGCSARAGRVPAPAPPHTRARVAHRRAGPAWPPRARPGRPAPAR